MRGHVIPEDSVSVVEQDEPFVAHALLGRGGVEAAHAERRAEEACAEREEEATALKVGSALPPTRNEPHIRLPDARGKRGGDRARAAARHHPERVEIRRRTRVESLRPVVDAREADIAAFLLMSTIGRFLR